MAGLERVRPATWLQAIAYGLMVVTGGVLVDFAINVITGGSLPGPFAPYQWFAWPGLILMFIASVGAAVRQYMSGHNTRDPSQHPSVIPPRRSPSAQLPDDIHEFTGRRHEIQALRELVLARADQRPSGPVVTTVYGRPGTGKSVLAIRFAREIRARYPDAQLYVDLKGAGAEKLDPAEALTELVRGLTADGHHDARDVGLGREYLRHLRTKRAMIVLDNATSESQVQPLIPRSPNCLVLITSRHRLDELEGNQPFRLGDMSAEDAIDLLVKIGGDRLLHGENLEATRQVAALCGRLPLALSIAGVHLRGHRAREVVSRLTDERSRLRELHAGDRDVRASFDVSYAHLSDAQRALFRRLKLLPESSFDAALAAALMDVTADEAAKALDALVVEQVLERIGDGRYGFNDLIGMFAKDKLEDEEPARESNAACERALRVYLTESTRRAALLEPAIAEVTGDIPLFPASLDEQLAALDWFERERSKLTMVGRQAEEIQAHEVTWRLAASLIPFFDLRGHRSDWAEVQQRALAAAPRTGRLEDQVWTWLTAGELSRLDRRYDEARFLLEEALEGADAGGWSRLQARALYVMGRVEHECQELDKALARYGRAAAIFADEGMLRGQASVVFNVATALHEQQVIPDGEILRLGESVLSALTDMAPDVWTLRTAGWIKEYLGRVAERAGDLEHAGAYCIASEQEFRRIGFRNGQGRVLRELGRIRLEQGNVGRAHEFLERSVAMFQAIGDDAQADEARTLLAEISAEAPPV